MLRLIAVFRHDDGKPAAKEVVRDFVDLGEAVRRQARALARGHDRGIKRVFDASLECRIEIGKLAHFVRRAVPCVQGIVENDLALGQRAGLVGTQNVHAAEVLDRFQAADDDATAAHGPGAGGQGHADDRRQQLRRHADRERDGKQEGLNHRATEKQIHRQDEQDDDDHRADQKVSELAHATPKIRLGLAGSEPCRDRPKRSPETGFDDEDLRRAALDRGAEKDCICPGRKGRLWLHDPRLLFDRK